jgi:hypothetical protein
MPIFLCNFQSFAIKCAGDNWICVLYCIVTGWIFVSFNNPCWLFRPSSYTTSTPYFYRTRYAKFMCFVMLILKRVFLYELLCSIYQVTEYTV